MRMKMECYAMRRAGGGDRRRVRVHEYLSGGLGLDLELELGFPVGQCRYIIVGKGR